MITVVKSEWHQVEKRYAIDLDENLLSEIYPELDEDDITKLLADLISGDSDIGQVIDDSYNNDVCIDWDWLDEDDWWTDRKGGYDVTYEVVNSGEEE